MKIDRPPANAPSPARARWQARPAGTYAAVKRHLRGDVLDAVSSGSEDPLADSRLGGETAGAMRGILEG